MFFDHEVKVQTNGRRWVNPQTVYKDGRYDSSQKVKPEHLDRPLVASCCTVEVINPAPSMLEDGTWAKLKDQSEHQIYFSQRWFLSIQVVLIAFLISLVLICYLTAVCANWCANNQWCCLPLVDTMETACVLAVAPNDVIRARWQWPCSGYFDIIFVQSGGSGGMLSIFLYSHWVNQ